MLSVSVPVLVMVTVLAALVVPTACGAKFTVVVSSVRTGATPVPPSGISCGLPATFSVMVSVPDRAPIAVGVKVMATPRTGGALLGFCTLPLTWPWQSGGGGQGSGVVMKLWSGCPTDTANGIGWVTVNLV